MRFKMRAQLANWKTYFIIPHDPVEAAPGARHPEMRDWPTEGFGIELTSHSVYDTDLDERLNNPVSPWVRNEFKHELCGKEMKKNVEQFLLHHAQYGSLFVLDEPMREPLTISDGDEAEAVRRFLANRKMGAANTTAPEKQRKEAVAT